MQLGDAASWLSAIGTVGALAFTAFTVRRQVNREQRADDYQRRKDAKQVWVEVDDAATHANVRNDGSEAIYRVSVYTRARTDDIIVAHSSALDPVIKPGEIKRFSLIKTEPKNPFPQDCVYFVQFTDSNGYRWNRYGLGLLEEVKPLGSPDGDRGRSNARLVKLSVTGEPLKQVEVVNGSTNPIHRVRVYTLNAVNGEVVTDSTAVVDTMAAHEHQRFDLSSTGRDSTSAHHVYYIAEFTDANNRQWNRYMSGHLDEIGPMPTLVRKRKGRPRRGEDGRPEPRLRA